MTSQNGSYDRSSNMISDDAVERINSEENNTEQQLGFSVDQINVPNKNFREYLSEKSASVKKSTIKDYSVSARHFHEYCDEFLTDDLMKIKPEKIQGFFWHCVKDQEHREKTVEKRKTVLAGFYEYYQLQKEYDPLISRIHVEKALKPEILKLCPEKIEREPISREEYDRLLNNADSALDRLIIQFTYETGGRNDDVRCTKVRDLSLDDATVKFRDSKYGIDYVVPLRSELVIKLRQWIENGREAYLNGRQSEYLFPSEHGPQLQYGDGLRKIVDSAARSAGIQDTIGSIQPNDGRGTSHMSRVTPHTLRHSIITHLSNDNVDLKYRQLLAGHSDPTTTEQIYTHDDDTAFDILREKIN
ncbi:tyrosine-type recombinase/integrase [Halorubrum trapanicum]|uniref:tyrosine-type recombinase/integrase n=1 Tax=Halorubrum trapanicum TaxID=29284 RepID=UPI003C700C84